MGRPTTLSGIGALIDHVEPCDIVRSEFDLLEHDEGNALLAT